MIAMDGNNSLKRVAKSARSDQRMFQSEFYLPEDFVDRYANEVKSCSQLKDSAGTSNPIQPNLAPPNPAPPNPAQSNPGSTSEGDPCDGATEHVPCAEQWKAAAAENLKKMWGIFWETGIFATACRHGFVLFIADMVESGEL